MVNNNIKDDYQMDSLRLGLQKMFLNRPLPYVNNDNFIGEDDNEVRSFLSLMETEVEKQKKPILNKLVKQNKNGLIIIENDHNRQEQQQQQYDHYHHYYDIPSKRKLKISSSSSSSSSNLFLHNNKNTVRRQSFNFENRNNHIQRSSKTISSLLTELHKEDNSKQVNSNPISLNNEPIKKKRRLLKPKDTNK